MKLRCGHESSVWKQEPPTSFHAYRVECALCPRKFEKWGTEAELRALQASGADVKIIPYKEPETGPTLDAFFHE